MEKIFYKKKKGRKKKRKKLFKKIWKKGAPPPNTLFVSNRTRLTLGKTLGREGHHTPYRITLHTSGKRILRINSGVGLLIGGSGQSVRVEELPGPSSLT